MLTILIIILIVMALGGVGFIPAPSFTPAARGTAGTVILILAIIWLVKYSGLL